ncbi:hypothetical protein ACNR9Q_04725 [Maribacter sp. X9]|uniref:hypothetical protein n=1 Tax=Maribacter sp. X9 TaxID=3402159 RepID=UPI003AF3B7D0
MSSIDFEAPKIELFFERTKHTSEMAINGKSRTWIAFATNSFYYFSKEWFMWIEPILIGYTQGRGMPFLNTVALSR